MFHSNTSKGFSTRLLFGFIAGFLSTLIFHQLALGLLWSAGVASSVPFSMTTTHPFGMPAVFSLAFWGGVWGILYALSERRFPRQGGYWVAAFLFGAVLPSLVALFLVLPLKNQPIGGGWHPHPLLTAFLINCAWGVGTGLILRVLLTRITSARQAWGMTLMVGGLAIACVLTGCGAAQTRGATTVGLSGVEIFGGKTAASVTGPVLFAGKDNKVCNCWTTSDSGGTWTASVSYSGQPGIGSSGVSVTGGKWFWQQGNDVIHFGKVKGGRVRWPATADADAFGCGKGVGSVSLSLTGVSEEGTFTGCLDDTHLDPRAEPFVFPPKMWGTLTLQRN